MMNVSTLFIPRESFTVSHSQFSSKLHPTLASVQATAKRVFEQPLIFNPQNLLIKQLNDTYHLTITHLQIFTSRVFSKIITDKDYLTLKKYQDELKNFAKNIDQASHLINHHEKQKAELLLHKADRFINRSAEIMHRRRTYQIAEENLNLAMEEFNEISYDPENGDPLLGMQAMDHMLDRLNALVPRYVHSSKDFPDYIKDQYAKELNVVELALEPFYEAVQNKIQREYSVLSHLLKNPNHSTNAAIQLKVLQEQIGCMHETSQNILIKMREWIGRWSSLDTTEDRIIYSRLKSLNEHLDQLDDLLMGIYNALHKTLVERGLIPTIPYGKETWNLLVRNRPKKTQGLIEKFIKKSISYLNPIEYLPKQWRPTPLQMKGFFLLTLTAGQQVHKYSQLFDQAARMRAEADRLQKKALESALEKVGDQLDKETSFIGTLLADKYDIIVSNPLVMKQLTKRFPSTAEFLSNIVARYGTSKPNSIDIQQIMEDYEIFRVAPFLSPFTYQTPQEWYKKFAFSEDLKEESQKVNEQTFSKTTDSNDSICYEERPVSTELFRPEKCTNLTDSLNALELQKTVFINWNESHGALQGTYQKLHEELLRIIAETPENALLTSLTWTQNVENLCYALEIFERNWMNAISQLPSIDRSALFKNLAQHPEQGHKLLKKMTFNGIIGYFDWSSLIQKLTCDSAECEKLLLGLGTLLIEIASTNSRLKSLLNVEDANGRSPIFWFTKAGDRVSIERLLELGAYINGVDVNGDTCSAVAVFHKREDILGMFINAKADLNKYVFEKGGWTPLLEAVWTDQKKIVEMLIAAGVNLNLKQNQVNNTPLHLAILNKMSEIAAMLIKAGARLDEINLEERTPLHYAIQSGDLEIVKLLINAGANPYFFIKCYAGQNNYVVEARGCRKEAIERYLSDNFPILTKEADEILKIKLIGHAWQIDGMVELSTKELPFKRETSLGMMYAIHPFTTYMVNTIEMAFKDRLDLLSINARNSIINVLKKFSLQAYSPTEMRADFLSGSPVIIPTGWLRPVGHQVMIVIFGTNFIICNKGAESLKPIEAYKIDPNRINVELIEKLISLREKKYIDFKNFFGSSDHVNPTKRINSPLLTQLGCLENLSECANPFFGKVTKESYESQRSQESNNCSWESLEVAIYVMMNLLTLSETENTDEASIWQIRNQMELTVTEWEEFTRMRVLDNYFPDLERNSTTIKMIIREIIQRRRVPKLPQYRNRFKEYADRFQEFIGLY